MRQQRFSKKFLADWHSAQQLEFLSKQIAAYQASGVADGPLQMVTIFFMAYQAAHPGKWHLSGGTRLKLERLRVLTSQWNELASEMSWKSLSVVSEQILKQLWEENISLFRIHRRVLEALYGWQLLGWPLRLVDYIPTVEQMLEQQALGERYVSFLYPKYSLEKNIEGRPIFSFFIHDLMHAAHFFANREHYQGQIQFYDYVRTAHGWLKKHERNLPAVNNDWQDQWEYLLSDMNGHPQYLKQTAQHLLQQRLQTSKEKIAQWNWQN